MKTPKHQRRILAILLMLALLLPALPSLSAEAAEPPKTEYSMAISKGEPRLLHSTQTSSVPLIDGTAVRWIDRIILSDEMRNLYDTLVEGADADGYQDILIDDSYLDTDYSIALKTKSFSLQGSTSSDQTAEINAAAYAFLDAEEDAVYAVLAAFDRDHPEVFWLNGGYTISCLPDVEGGRCTLTLLLKFKDDTKTIRHATYTSGSQIRAAISERDALVNAILSNLSPTASTYEKLFFFNDLLTKTNEYNTSNEFDILNGNIPSDSRECMAALDGRIGQNGPICESYARAFKVLCDAEGIPCVLVDGANHMWNYVQVGSFWYAVDVTWNDPPHPYFSGAVSGMESTDYFLVGANTQIEREAFLSSHPVQNQVYVNDLCFTNGPELSAERYTDSISVVPVLSGEELVYDGTAHTPEILVKNGSNVIDSTMYSISYTNNVKPGMATVTVHILSGVYAGSYTASFVIRKRPLEILPDAPSKVYDGTTAVALTPKYDSAQLVAGDEFDLTLRGEFVSSDVGTNLPLSVHIVQKGEDMAYYDLILPERLFGTITQATLPAVPDDTANDITFSQKGFSEPIFTDTNGETLSGAYSYFFGEWGPFSYESIASRLSLCLSEEATDDPMILAMREKLREDGALTIRCSFTDGDGNYKALSTELTFTPKTEKQETATETADSSEETSDTAGKPGGNNSGKQAGRTQSGDSIIKTILICALLGVALIPTGLVTFVIIFFAVRAHKTKKAKKEAAKKDDSVSS